MRQVTYNTNNSRVNEPIQVPVTDYEVANKLYVDQSINTLSGTVGSKFTNVASWSIFTDQAIADVTPVVVPWDDEDPNVSTLVEGVGGDYTMSPTGTITVLKPGLWHFTATVVFGGPNSDNGFRKIYMIKNGNTLENATQTVSAANQTTLPISVSTSHVWSLNVNETIEVYAFSAIAGGQNLLSLASSPTNKSLLFITFIPE